MSKKCPVCGHVMAKHLDGGGCVYYKGCDCDLGYYDIASTNSEDYTKDAKDL